GWAKVKTLILWLVSWAQINSSFGGAVLVLHGRSNNTLFSEKGEEEEASHGDWGPGTQTTQYVAFELCSPSKR
ncbi:hypothetical protein SESBI_50816, partial [Sesbania bispinosa]